MLKLEYNCVLFRLTEETLSDDSHIQGSNEQN